MPSLWLHFLASGISLIQLTITTVSGSLGIWLFYLQHQFEDTYWRAGREWDYTDSAMQGSSFYRLPAILNWFSGNIAITIFTI